MTRRTEVGRTWSPGDEALASVRDAASSRTATGVLGGCVLALVGAATALRVANNAPGPLPPRLESAQAVLATAGGTAVAALVVLLGLAHDDERARAGLAFAGVFAVLGLHVPSAAVPAVVGVVGGAALVVVALPAAGTPHRTTVVAGVVWAGLALSLASATGVVAPALRPTASTVALAALAALALVVPTDWRAWVAAGAAAVAVLWLGASAPFVTGAVVLVGAGVVGAPLVAVAAGAGGGAGALAGAVSSGRPRAALAVGLVVVAAVPATVPRALAAAAGLALLVGGERP